MPIIREKKSLEGRELEEREDNHYLKQYVKNHPDNQMAWYLLGKDYILQGKEAKANYCFLQAGEVYEAYERKKHPLIAKTPEEAIKRWNRKRTIKSLVIRSATAGILLLCLSLMSPAATRNGTTPQKNEEAPASAAVDTPIEGVGVIFLNMADSSAAGKALETMLYGASEPAYSLAVRLEQDKQWRKWTGQTKVVLSVERLANHASAAVKLLDAVTCQCVPEDASRAFQTLKGWNEQREQQWVLSSAIAHYKEIHEEWPSALDQLIRPYPANLLSGETSGMKMMFPEMLKQMKEDEANKDVSQGSNGGNANVTNDKNSTPAAAQQNAGIADQLPAKPLEIIVDKRNHRLALVSGDVIIRSYGVGLGGTRTPEGSFAITEKVKNPNGRDDGDFGSRGMTLSETRYAIHGTNKPGSIGKDQSEGCIRMKREDVEELFDMTPIGTKVTITNGALPEDVSESTHRFKLIPKQNETNPAKVYHWL